MIQAIHKSFVANPFSTIIKIMSLNVTKVKVNNVTFVILSEIYVNSILPEMERQYLYQQQRNIGTHCRVTRNNNIK